MCSPRRGHDYSAIQGIAWYCVLEAWYIYTIASSVRFCCWHYNCRRHALLVAATAFSCRHGYVAVTAGHAFHMLRLVRLVLTFHTSTV
jgi:hypothetical protein